MPAARASRHRPASRRRPPASSSRRVIATVIAPPPIGYTADQRPRAARGATHPTVRSRGRWYDPSCKDEARVGQQGTLTRVWARRGTRPRAARDRRYAWAYLFGAVCPERAGGAALVPPYADTEATGPHRA